MSHGQFLLCAPAHGLACFACCPPIRPAGYDHADHRASLTRLLSENTAAFKQGRLPTAEITGYWCPGLGFLDPAGRTVACLLHPAQHQGQDLRGPTGYQDKCQRESCNAARAFGQLEPGARQTLLAACQGMDSFEYSSPRLNPLMRLLAFGPGVATAAASIQASREDMAAWAWLHGLEPALGWLLGRALAAWGAEALAGEALAPRLEGLARDLVQRLGPATPLEQGAILTGLCDEWEARCWRHLLGRARARQSELERWRGAVASLLSG